MSDRPLQAWLETPRALGVDERQWIEKLLSQDFVGYDVLRRQMNSAVVVGYCTCGCRSINLCVDQDEPRFAGDMRVPVEMQVAAPDGTPILFLLHVVSGYLNELEVLRADISPVNTEPDLEHAQITVNQ